MSSPISIRVRVPMNIAFVKYWGKADKTEMLPLNDSVSVNLNDLHATTEITIIPNSEDSDSVKVNEVDFPCGEGTRFFKVFTEFRRIAGSRIQSPFSIKISSRTTFPVKAGLASSAAGFSALAYGLGKSVNMKDSEIARLARLGSGSACRSLLPGFVHWDASKTSPTDDFVFSLSSNQDFQSSLLAFVFIFNKKEKVVGSSEGMSRTVQTSEFLKYRVEKVVPDHVRGIKAAIASGNFGIFAEITMKESNSLHAVCLDSFPPLWYLNNASFEFMDFVHKINAEFGEVVAAYTFDAGPNPVVLIQRKNAEFFVRNLIELENFKFRFVSQESNLSSFDENLKKFINQPDTDQCEKIEVIITGVGDGPRIC
ncbi:hypothetical protein FO519_006308 [Halicephalobus sp. NKZ332]|nr:hypothetical protein FO519_006308 [Halicephalobus sp. NKZ332]